MCNILWLKAGQMPLERSEFDNMCYNNWHSYGLITIVDDMMDVTRKVPESGEVDPEELWNLLLKDRQFDRYLHVRHNTAGGTTLENCHPFDVFFQERKGKSPRNVQFMHNGTLYDYKSKIYEGSMVKDDLDPDAPSDSKNFVDQILVPYIAAMDFGNGKGDIENTHLRILLNKFWPATGNRGILISNDQKPMILGSWKTMKASDGSDILSANDEYFKEVTRGPEKARRVQKELEEKKKESSFRPSIASSSTAITPFTQFDFTSNRRHSVFGLTESFKHILNDWNVWDRSTAIALGAATQDELREVHKDESACIALMDWIFADYYNLYNEHQELEDKHDKASKLVATLKGELQELRKWAMDKGLFEEKKAS